MLLPCPWTLDESLSSLCLSALTYKTKGWRKSGLEVCEFIHLPAGASPGPGFKLHLGLTLLPSRPCPHLWQWLAGSPAD